MGLLKVTQTLTLKMRIKIKIKIRLIRKKNLSLASVH